MLSSRAGRLTLFMSAVLLPLKLGAPSALAETWEGDPPFALGHESCSQYLTDIANDQSLELLYDAWLSGYIKVVGERFEGVATPVAEAEMAGASAWVKSYCRQRTDDSYLTAAVRLLAARERRQSGGATPRI